MAQTHLVSIFNARETVSGLRGGPLGVTLDPTHLQPSVDFFLNPSDAVTPEANPPRERSVPFSPPNGHDGQTNLCD
jgi:hypothetical protein